MKKFWVLLRIILIIFGFANMIILAICIKDGVGNLLLNISIILIWHISSMLNIKFIIDDHSR